MKKFVSTLGVCVLVGAIGCESEPSATGSAKSAAPKAADAAANTNAKPSPTPSAEAAPAKADAKPTTNPPTEDSAKIVDPVVDEKAARAALQQGRKLAKDGDQKGALRAFAAAVRNNPADGSALCEAGWASFKLGELTQARDFLARGLRVADAKTKPACLYNMGRVEEAAKAPELAAVHYRASLALRGNAEAQKRLDALGNVDAPSCARAWEAQVQELPAAQIEVLGKPHPVTDTRQLEVVLLKHEKPYVGLVMHDTEAGTYQDLGVLTEMDLEEHATKLKVEFAVDGNTVDVAYHFAYADAEDLARWEVTGFESGCEEWEPGEALDEPCGPVVEKMYAASKRPNHVACDVSDANEVECSETGRTRKAAARTLASKSACLSWDCCWGKPVE